MPQPTNDIFILVRTNARDPCLVDTDRHIHFSVYGENREDHPPNAHFYNGGKWAGIFDFFLAQPSLIDQHDYFWFPDDDIEADAETIDDFLTIALNQDFDLAQPALTHDSYFADPLTLAHPSFEFRRTNFVELMMPLFSREILLRALPLFEGRHAALGMDLFWHHLSIDPARKVAIIDAAPMRHTRPRGKHLNNRMAQQQLNIQDEKRTTMKALSISRPWPVVRSARLLDGRELVRGPRLWWQIWKDLWNTRAQRTRQSIPILQGLELLGGQVLGRPDRVNADLNAIPPKFRPPT
jgi:hypothetical protein